MIRRRLVRLAVPALLAVASVAPAQDDPAAAASAPPAEAPAPAPATPSEDSALLHPRVALETNLGTIVVELDGEKAPISTVNFAQYAADGFYDGLIFHRVMDGFMIQGGGFTPDMDQKRDGVRAPIKNEWKNGLKNLRGTIAMARTQVHDSATAQFFINVVDNAALDRPNDGAGYAVFGKVVEGMDVVDKIKTTPTTTHAKYPAGPVVPKETVLIRSAKLQGGASIDAIREAAGIARARSVLADAVKKVEAETGKKAQFVASKLVNGSGLGYVVMQESSGARPKPTDKVKVHYTGWLVNGKKFDSSVDRGEPATFPLNRVISGWTEGVGLMSPGSRFKLLIPPEMGYGSNGAGDDIPGDSVLVFEVELLEIQ